MEYPAAAVFKACKWRFRLQLSVRTFRYRSYRFWKRLWVEICSTDFYQNLKINKTSAGNGRDWMWRFVLQLSGR